MEIKKRKVAIFDIDGTIFRSSLLIALIEGLIEAGMFSPKIRKEYEKELNRWQDRKGEYEDYILKVVEAFMVHVKGLPFESFEQVAKKVVQENQDRIYRYSRDLIRDLKKKKYFLLAISQSPWGIANIFSKNLGFDKVYGRFYELGPSDQFTGKIIDEHLIANKGTIVKRAIEKENLTLRDSIGVGDTEGDIAMLELVENPICFNPNMKLYRTAKRQGWKVVVERKDVIYTL